MDFCEVLEKALLSKIVKWTTAAKTTIGFKAK